MKRLVSAAGLLALVSVGIGSSVLLARQQNQPGLPTVGRMLILNRERAEAIPVTVQGGDALSVVLMGNPAVSLVPNAAVATHAARQSWEYQQIQAPAATDLSVALTNAGANGWEAVGVVPAIGASPATILLKRPR
ncbi:MAG: hypothetical protein ABI051_09045 [Vicinamibacterales bacterium]